MRRPVIAVAVTDVDAGAIVHTETRSAWNAAVRASEAAVRAIARGEGQLYTGGDINRRITGPYAGSVGDTATRYWSGDRSGRKLAATITVNGQAD